MNYSYAERGHPTKWYVQNGTIQVLVIARSALDACIEALSYMKFKDSQDIPDYLLPWECFTVDQSGFKHIDGTLVPINNAGMIQVERTVYAMHVIETDEVLDAFDEKQRKYDPFCEQKPNE